MTSADGKVFNTLHIREMRNKTILRQHYTLTRTTEMTKTDPTKCWPRYGAAGTHMYCQWEWKPVQPLWEKVWHNTQEYYSTTTEMKPTTNICYNTDEFKIRYAL